MPSIQVSIIRFVDEHQPGGFVEAEFADADGTLHTLDRHPSAKSATHGKIRVWLGSSNWVVSESNLGPRLMNAVQETVLLPS